MKYEISLAPKQARALAALIEKEFQDSVARARLRMAAPVVDDIVRRRNRLLRKQTRRVRLYDLCAALGLHSFAHYFADKLDTGAHEMNLVLLELHGSTSGIFAQDEDETEYN